MGLDKRMKRVLNKTMGIKLLLTQVGLGLKKVLGMDSKRLSPMARERISFEEDVRDQLKELKRKGLSIPVFTL